MGATTSLPPKPIQGPDDLHVFKKLDGVPDEFNIPEIPERRKPTDQFFLIVFLLMTVSLGILSIYTISYSDLNRITYGYDNCGNVCGEKNAYVENINCSGKDYREEKFLLYKDEGAMLNLDELDFEENQCVDHCNSTEYMKILNRCFKRFDNITDYKISQINGQAYRDLKASIGNIFAMVFFALFACYFMLLLYKFCLGFLVKTLMIIIFVLITGCTILLWFSENRAVTGFKVIFTLVCVLVDFGVIVFWKRLSFVVKIFNEATNAVFAMPSLLIVPVLIFIIDIILMAAFVALMTLYFASGILVHLFDEFYTYEPTSLMKFTIVYAVIFYVYLNAFLHGCQQIIVASSVSTWYFTREKENVLGSPVAESFNILTRFHLGTVAFGSLIITIVKILRAVVRGMERNRNFVCFKLILNCCIDFFEEIIHYISDQAYIMVAMHGQPFIESGRRATKLLINNALNTLAINTAGDFVLWISKFIIVILTLICGTILDDGAIEYYYVSLMIGSLLSGLLAHCVFRNFEICVDTIFLCYCEDTFIHDGIERPYYAPVNLVTLVDEAKGVIEEEKMYNSVKTEAIPPPDFV